MLVYFTLLLLLYLTPFTGYWLAKYCGKEPWQGRKLFETLHYLILLTALSLLAYHIHPGVFFFGLVLYLPLYCKARNAAAPSLAGFLYGLAAYQTQMHYEISVLLFLYGLVEGTLYRVYPKKKGTRFWLQHLPFLMIGLASWILAISFK